jgi:hypothetical protein
MSRINIEQLIKEIKQLERHQLLYGYWKNRQRGDPAKGFKERGRTL